MSSFTRRLQRRILRSSPDYEPAPQPTIIRKDGSYKTLRPTRGWLEMSALRVLMQFKLADILTGSIATPKPAKQSKLWRKPMAVPEGTITRQQRRAKHPHADVTAAMRAAV